MNPKQQKDWLQQIEAQALKWGHIIYKVTGFAPARRSYVLWSCSHHPDGGSNCFDVDDSTLNSFVNSKNLSARMLEQELNELILNHSGDQFYATRMDEYLSNRQTCCRQQQNQNRTKDGFKLFQNLLIARGEHYNTIYTLQIGEQDYRGKHVPVPIKCETHGVLKHYSMKNLNTMTSCPCPECRVDPLHKNEAVEIIKRRNAGRPGQVIRHAGRVKAKYNNACALSNSKFDLHHHHLDGQDFYTETSLLWEHNGICLCSTIHRDYHFNFLSNHSRIAPLYSEKILEQSQQNVLNQNNPDFDLNGAEVSRYTFLEFLRFLIHDLKFNHSQYVNSLNAKMAQERISFVGELDASDPSPSELGEITLERLETGMERFCLEYKGENWALSSRGDIPYANDQVLWNKVDQTWQ